MTDNRCFFADVFKNDTLALNPFFFLTKEDFKLLVLASQHGKWLPAAVLEIGTFAGGELDCMWNTFYVIQETQPVGIKMQFVFVDLRLFCAIYLSNCS